ncbi:MAG: phosphate ABC transporter permease PstA [Candidatus Thermoplasmatota archaeon]
MTAGVAVNPLAANTNLVRRRRVEKVARALLLTGALTTVALLLWLLGRLTLDGLPHFTSAFWTDEYSPGALRRGEPVGVLDAIQATLGFLGMTMAIALPLGIAGGIYLNEYAPHNRFTRLLRLTISNLAGVPSVVYGILGLAIFIRFVGLEPNLLAAALTMATLILPILIIATEEALKTVPASVREASLALGATRWQTLRSHTLPYAMPGILTGSILALSRAAGETAPLLILGIPAYATVAGWGPFDAGTPLQVRAYFLASDAREAALNLAAASVVVLLVSTLVLNLAAITLRQWLGRRIKW